MTRKKKPHARTCHRNQRQLGLAHGMDPSHDIVLNQLACSLQHHLMHHMGTSRACNFQSLLLLFLDPFCSSSVFVAGCVASAIESRGSCDFYGSH